MRRPSCGRQVLALERRRRRWPSGSRSSSRSRRWCRRSAPHGTAAWHRASLIMASVIWISPPAPRLLLLEHREDLRLQNVAARDVQVGRRRALRRFSTIVVMRLTLALRVFDADDAVLVRLVLRHGRDGDVVAAASLRRPPSSRRCRACAVMQHVGQQQRERLVADDIARAPHGMAETERRLLAREARLARASGSSRHQLFELLRLLLAGERRSARTGCRNDPRCTPLLRPVTKMKCSMPAARASSTTCWMTGLSTTVSISLAPPWWRAENGCRGRPPETRLCECAWLWTSEHRRFGEV